MISLPKNGLEFTEPIRGWRTHGIESTNRQEEYLNRQIHNICDLIHRNKFVCRSAKDAKTACTCQIREETMGKFGHRQFTASISAAFLIPAWANGEPTPQFAPIDIRDAPLEYRQFEKVEITGSAILAKEAKEALPLQVISRRDIERSGVTNLAELLHQLPAMANFQEVGTMTGTVDGGPEAAAIHGNQSGTLVLLNGRRLPFYGSQTIAGERAVVDLNFIPLMAIERVELLTDGASSRYGSDAVAGVVNIITKSSVNALTFSAERTRPKQGVATGNSFTLSWGKGKIDRDEYSLQIHYSAQKQNALLAGDRPASREGLRVITIDGKQYWNSAQPNYSLYSAPAQNLVDSAGQLRNTFFEKNGRCTPGAYTVDYGSQPLCLFNTQPLYTLYPAIEKQQLYLKGEKHLGQDWIGFSEIILGRHSQISVPYSYNEYDNVLPDGSVALMTAVPLDVTRQRYENLQRLMILGIRGHISGWDFVSSISSGHHRVDRSYFAGLLNKANNLNELMLTPFETQQNPSDYTAETRNKFAPYIRPSYPVMLDTGNTQLQSFESMASREIYETEHGPLALGLGLNTRTEKVSYESFGNQTLMRPAFSGHRTNTAYYAELQAPITAQLETTSGLRHDIYSDFGGITSGKIGWKLKTSDRLFLRGSWGSGFRAPTLGQMSTEKSFLLSAVDMSNNVTLPIYNSGNPNLKPEKSQQWTLGFRLEPNKQWTLGLDYWRLHITDAFGNLSANKILSNIDLKNQYLQSNENGTYISSPNINLGQAHAAGIDYDVQWRQPTDWGVLRWSIKGTHFLKSEKQISNDSVFESDLGRYSQTSNTVTPRHQLTLRSVLDRGDWSVTASANYRSGNSESVLLSDLFGNPINYEHQVAPFWTLDLGARWSVLPNLMLSTLVSNVLDHDPPQRLLTTGILQGVDTRYANYYGRTLKLKAEYRF